jgi:uncharacterized protein (DUF1697 family)
MKTWIALFKGINVGGNNKVPMKALVQMFEGLGYQSVRHYIQSGNVVFQSNAKSTAALAKQIVAAMQETFGFATHVLLIAGADLDQAVAGNPYPELQDDDLAKMHLYCLDREPAKIDTARIASIIQPGERWHAKGAYFYLHTPGGAGNSKLAAQVEKITGTLATARNWRTVLTLQTMASELG